MELSEAIKYHQSGELEKAEIAYKNILGSDPDNTNVLYFLGILYYQKQNYPDAIRYTGKATELYPTADNYFNLANIYFDSNDIDSAILNYENALRLKPDYVPAYNSLASAYQEKREFDRAMEYLAKSLEINSNYPETYFNLGNIFEDKGEIDRAIQCFRKVLELDPNCAQAYVNIGNLLFYKDKVEEEMLCYQKAIELSPDCPEIYNNLGNIFREKGLIDKSIEYFKKAVELRPDYAEAHTNLGIDYLTVKNFDDGLKEYEWRLNYKGITKNLNCPMWDGGDIKGKTLYVYHEQGFGDTINFARYITLLSDLGINVLFRSQQELYSLLKDNIRAEFVDKNTGDDELKFDYHIPLLSLPHIFKTNVKNIPFKGTYIKANEEKVQYYKKKFFDNDKFKIGINWKCKNLLYIDQFRSLPDINSLSCLARFPDVKVYSLQKGPGVEELDNLPEITNLGETFNDFSDTAAAWKIWI